MKSANGPLALAALAACCLLALLAHAGEFELSLDGQEQTFTVENPGPEVVRRRMWS